MEDILTRPRALRALVVLRKVGRPMTMTELGAEIAYEFPALRALRDDLAEWGLVEANPGPRNSTLLALTAAGRATADLAMKTEATAEQGRPARKRS